MLIAKLGILSLVCVKKRLKSWACHPFEKGDTNIVQTNTTPQQDSAAQGLQKEPKMSLQKKIRYKHVN